MAIYNKKQRVANETFPGGRFPMGDAGHARAALGRINQGGLSPEQKATVRARAHRILGAAKRSVSANV